MKAKSATRREFIKQSGVLLSAALLPIPAFAMEKKQNFKMGLQLFTIRDAMANNPVESLKKVTALGYQDLETYGYDPEKNSFYGHEASAFKHILEDHQLTTSSGHYAFSPFMEQSEDALKRYVDQCITGAKAINQRYITWPWVAEQYRNIESFKLMIAKLNLIGEQVTKAGLGFAYHNHGFEFIEHNEETGYDLILNGTDPNLVKLQMDLYWVMHSSKKKPSEWVAKQPGRYVMWHIKDMDKVTRDYTELGNGSIDYTKILPDPATSGLEYYFLEQGGNFATNSIQSITDSASFFKKNLQKYL